MDGEPSKRLIVVLLVVAVVLSTLATWKVLTTSPYFSAASPDQTGSSSKQRGTEPTGAPVSIVVTPPPRPR